MKNDVIYSTSSKISNDDVINSNTEKTGKMNSNDVIFGNSESASKNDETFELQYIDSGIL